MDIDREVLEHLKERGTDFAKPHAIEFYVYFPTVEAAEKRKPDIEKRGYRVQVLFDPTGKRWLCLSIRDMLAELEAIRSCKKELNALAESLGGHCDAWGTQVEK